MRQMTSMDNETQYSQMADIAYSALWTRNATKMGWCQHCRWSKTLGWHLQTRDKNLIRKVFGVLLNRGHFLLRRLCNGSHPHYLFVPEAIVDEEAKDKAISYYRWWINWNKGWKADWAQYSQLPTPSQVGQIVERSSP